MAGIEQIVADFEKLKSACKDIENKKILVGIVGGANSDVIKIAHAHEYGDGRLPERSFIRASFDADRNQIEQFVSTAVERVLDGKISVSTAAEMVGAQSAQLVQNYIDSNRVKPPSDFSKKTQHTTLYETGTHIRDRIAYKVVEE